MATKSNYETLIRTVNESSSLGGKRGLGFLYSEDEVLNGREIILNGKKLIHFGSCGYLGLELDPRLKEAAIEAVGKYGTYFSCSRTYVSCGNYKELENLLEKVFNAPILLTTNSTLGHQSVMPIVIGGNDLVIYDQQAHISMHELAYKLRHYGTEVTILRHNRLDELETKIIENKEKFDKIWYVVDGVFSMFGDLPNTRDIIRLLDKHKKLHLYIDDAHGMSWAGPNGSGYTLSQTKLHQKMVLGTSMAKGFGSCGGIFVFPDSETRDKVKGWGGPLTYSGPQEPATVAAAIASAKIHLSGEITELQDSLQEKIKFCNYIMEKYQVPLISDSISPIFFVGTGLMKVGYNLVQRMINDGFYTNISVFPAVPETCAGMRFTITNHLTFEDIENLGKAIAYHFPKVLVEEERTMNDIFRAFRKFSDIEKKLAGHQIVAPQPIAKPVDNLSLKVFHSIKEIDKDMWNSFFLERGAMDHYILSLYEDVFNGNAEKENNWKFFYYIIEDNNKVVLATFFTSALSKDDMVSSTEISEKVEDLRKHDPYYLTSKYFTMGTLLTNGDHLYVDRQNLHWKKAIVLLLDEVWKEQDKQKASVVLFRDFACPDDELMTFMMDQGFVKTENPENNIIRHIQGLSIEDYVHSKLNKNKRSHLRNDILKYEIHFETTVDDYKESDLEYFYALYKNIKAGSLALNTFDLPFKLFQAYHHSANFETIVLRTRDDHKMVSVVFCYKSPGKYCPILIGIDKSLGAEMNVYKQTLYQIIKRGLQLNVTDIHFGLTASQTKYKLGADTIPQMGFIQMKDHFNMDFIESLQ
jgi:7-keto-8-aminopelargonate synthetase-like enzyme